MPAIVAVAIFIIGAGLTIWATEELLTGLVNLATYLKLSAFVVSVVLSGLEAENIAVGLSASVNGLASLALGTIFGGATFLICIALGLGSVIYPLEVKLPNGFLILFAATPVVAGLGLIAPTTPRWVGIVLLLAFFGGVAYLVLASRKQTFLLSHEVEKAQGKKKSLAMTLALTMGGIVLVSIGGELVAIGAENIITSFGVSAALMGMVVTPATIELEEVARQAIPSKRGRSDVAAGNLIGTLLYFLLFNFGLIILIAPVNIPSKVVQLDWPFLIGVTWIATLFLWRGKVSRGAGVLLVVTYLVYVGLNVATGI